MDLFIKSNKIKVYVYIHSCMYAQHSTVCSYLSAVSHMTAPLAKWLTKHTCNLCFLCMAHHGDYCSNFTHGTCICVTCPAYACLSTHCPAQYSARCYIYTHLLVALLIALLMCCSLNCSLFCSLHCSLPRLLCCSVLSSLVCLSTHCSPLCHACLLIALLIVRPKYISSAHCCASQLMAPLIYSLSCSWF